MIKFFRATEYNSELDKTGRSSLARRAQKAECTLLAKFPELIIHSTRIYAPVIVSTRAQEPGCTSQQANGWRTRIRPTIAVLTGMYT